MRSKIKFTHLNIERYTHLRTDENLRNISLDRKKYIVFCNGKPVFQVNTSSFELTVPLFSHTEIPTQYSNLFLGKKEEHYFFAVNLHEIPQEKKSVQNTFHQ